MGWYSMNPIPAHTLCFEFINSLEASIMVVIYDVAPWRYSGGTKILGFFSVFVVFVSETESKKKKNKKTRGPSSSRWVKVPWWKSRKGWSLRQKLCPITHSFYQVCVWPRTKSLPPHPPPIKDPFGLALDWQARSSLHSTEEVTKATSARGG